MSKPIVVLNVGSGIKSAMFCAAEDESPMAQVASSPRYAVAAAAR
jgi:hypothetical protein